MFTVGTTALLFIGSYFSLISHINPKGSKKGEKCVSCSGAFKPRRTQIDIYAEILFMPFFLRVN